jgi:hypothetical protein
LERHTQQASPNKALQLTAIPPRFIVDAELCCSLHGHAILVAIEQLIPDGERAEKVKVTLREGR